MFSEAFILSGLFHLIALLMCIVFIGAMVGALGMLVYGLMHFSWSGLWGGILNIPHYLWVAALHVGWALFLVVSVIGCCLSWAWFGISAAGVWVWQAVPEGLSWLWGKLSSAGVSAFDWIFSAQTWINAGKWIVAIVCTVVGTTVLMVLFLLALCYIFFNERFWAFIELKANGYAAARDERETARIRLEHSEEYLQKRDEENYARSKRSRERAEKFEKVLDSIWEYLQIIGTVIIFVPKWVGIGIFAAIIAFGMFCRNLYAKPVYKQGQLTYQLGPIGFVWKMIVAFKKGACPLIEFAESADLKDSPHPRPPAAS